MMMPHFPEKPYEITKAMWDDYYAVQQSGHMNMMGHRLIGYFMPDGAWQTAYDHFEVAGETTPVVIE